MPGSTKLDIIKGAILLEHRGKALYESVVDNTKIDSVKKLFEFLVKEEERHIKILEEQYSRASKNQNFQIDDLKLQDFEMSDQILSDKIVKDVFGAGYEAALISAALDFEKSAVNYYAEQEKTADTEEGKKLFGWLTEWEKGHMMMLSEIDREIKEQIWYDNQFWPMD